MRKMIASVALLGLTGVASASEVLSVETVKYAGEWNLVTGNQVPSHQNFGPDIAWDNGNFDTGFFSGATDRERLDWGDVATGTVVNGFQIAYATDVLDSVDITVAFYDSEDGNNTPGSEVINVFTLTGLPGSVSGGIEGYIIDIDLEGGLEFAIDGADLDGDGLSDFGYSYNVTTNAATTNSGPLISSESFLGSAPGRENAYDRYNEPGKWAGSSYVGTFTSATLFLQYHMILYTPEPAALGLLALASMVVIRRR